LLITKGGELFNPLHKYEAQNCVNVNVLSRFNIIHSLHYACIRL